MFLHVLFAFFVFGSLERYGACDIDPDVVHENSSFLSPGAYAPENCFHVT